MTSTVFVVGSNSFSGASFIRYLLDLGLNVVGISRSAEYKSVFLPYQFNSSGKRDFQFYQLDLNYHIDEIEKLLDQHKPSLVFNFAAQSMVAQSWDSPVDWYQTNVISLVKFIDVLRHKDYLDKYVHISTPEVYGSLSGYVQENRNYHPSTPYAISRAAADMHLYAYFQAHNLPVLMTRAANVYGPGQQLYRIIPKTILSILSGQRLPLHGGGYSERSFIHIDDVSSATWQIANEAKAGEIFHIATKSTVSIRELVQLLCTRLGVEFAEIVNETEDRVGKDAAYLLGSDKLRKELAWSDQISLDEGLTQVIQWVQNNFKQLSELPWVYQHKP